MSMPVRKRAEVQWNARVTDRTKLWLEWCKAARQSLRQDCTFDSILYEAMTAYARSLRRDLDKAGKPHPPLDPSPKVGLPRPVDIPNRAPMIDD